MGETVKRGLRWFGLLLGLITAPLASRAHQLDEYLQATLVSIEPGEVRLQIHLTPGVAVAERVLALIDRDHDGVISTNEAAAYSASLARGLTVRLDGREVPLRVTAAYFPEPDDLRTGWGIISLEFSARVGPLAEGPHRVSLANRHLSALSVYLLNATRPDSRSIQIGKQTRTKTQSDGEIEFRVSG